MRTASEPGRGARLGVDLGGTSFLAVVLGPDGAVRAEVQGATLDHHAPDEVLDRVAAAALDALTDAGVTVQELVAVGIGLPGEVNIEAGTFRCSPIFPTWVDVPVAEALSARLGLSPGAGPQVRVENDANATLLGELALGAGRGADPVVLLTLGTGVGGAIAVGGRLVRGSQGSAGELGHLPVDAAGPPCGCGGVGCLGVMASAPALARIYRAHAGLDEGAWVDGSTVAAAWRAGEAAAEAAIEAVASALARGLASAAVVLAPERAILFGGLMAGLGEPLIKALRRQLSRVPYPAAVAALDVVPAALGARAGAIGASLLEQSP